METLLIIVALLASNIFLIKKILKKPEDAPRDAPKEPSAVPEPTKPKEETKADDTIVGPSRLSDDFVQSIYEKLLAKKLEGKLEAKAEEDAERIFTEMTRWEDVTLAEDEQKEHIPQIPDEKLNDTFKNTTVSEADGSETEPEEPRQGGHGFNELNKAVAVAKDAEASPEAAMAAKEALASIAGTKIEEEIIAVSPEIRTRLMKITLCSSVEDLRKGDEEKTTVYEKSIDTRDVDKIKVNILT